MARKFIEAMRSNALELAFKEFNRLLVLDVRDSSTILKAAKNTATKSINNRVTNEWYNEIVKRPGFSIITCESKEECVSLNLNYNNTLVKLANGDVLNPEYHTRIKVTINSELLEHFYQNLITAFKNQIVALGLTEEFYRLEIIPYARKLAQLMNYVALHPEARVDSFKNSHPDIHQGFVQLVIEHRKHLGIKIDIKDIEAIVDKLPKLKAQMDSTGYDLQKIKNILHSNYDREHTPQAVSLVINQLLHCAFFGVSGFCHPDKLKALSLTTSDMSIIPESLELVTAFTTSKISNKILNTYPGNPSSITLDQKSMQQLSKIGRCLSEKALEGYELLIKLIVNQDTSDRKIVLSRLIDNAISDQEDKLDICDQHHRLIGLENGSAASWYSLLEKAGIADQICGSSDMATAVHSCLMGEV